MILCRQQQLFTLQNTGKGKKPCHREVPSKQYLILVIKDVEHYEEPLCSEMSLN